MVQIVTSVKNTFVHVDIDRLVCVEKGSNARRRAASTPARMTLDAAEHEEHDAHLLEAHDLEESPLLPHDDDDYDAFVHAHSCPPRLETDVKCMLSSDIPEKHMDYHFCVPSFSQPRDETIYGFNDALTQEMESYNAYALAYHGSTYAAQLPNGYYGESLVQHLPCFSTAPPTLDKPAQRQLFSTSPIPPREEQRDSYTQPCCENVPTTTLCNEEDEETQSEDGERTTVMLMNVPRGYTNSKLMRTLDSEGFAGMYDFIYVPMAAARTSKGYAFVNWVDPFVAERFVSAFDGFSRWLTASKNVCHAVWAKKHQGLQANIERYRNSTVLGKSVPEEYKPRIFKNGEEMPFPAPTRKPSMLTGRVEQPRKTNSQQALLH